MLRKSVLLSDRKTESVWSKFFKQFNCSLKLPEAAKPRTLHIKGDLVTWIRPATLDELLELKTKYPQAKLVIGNTEIGE